MKRVRAWTVAALTLVAASACAPGQPELKLGARAIAVDLAYSNPALAKPVEPEVIVRIIPAPPEVVSGEATIEEVALSSADAPPAGLPPAPTSRTCPTAPAGAAPAEVAHVVITKRPVPGVYGRHNTGTFGISAGGLNLLLPFPAESKDTVSAPREVAPRNALSVGPSPDQKGSGVFEWSVLHTITPTFTTSTTYQLTADAIAIVRRVTVSQAGEQVFEPSPPVTLMELKQGVGDSWRSAGVDAVRRTALSIEGRIESVQAVDLCGELVDSFRVVTRETFVNLETGETSGTDTDGANVYNVATQAGGLLIRAELHYTQQTRQNGTPIVITYDYTSTMDGLRPRA